MNVVTKDKDGNPWFPSLKNHIEQIEINGGYIQEIKEYPKSKVMVMLQSIAKDNSISEILVHTFTIDNDRNDLAKVECYRRWPDNTTLMIYSGIFKNDYQDVQVDGL